MRKSRSTLLVQVRTDDGVTGLGSCSGNGPLIEFIIESVFKPVLIGKDPTKVEGLWDECYFHAGVRAFGSRGVGVVALSGVDIALWDIAGKVQNAPLFKLLGNASRDRVEVYATALYPEETARVVARARAFAEQGFRGVKIKIGFDLARDMEIVKAVRAELGRNFPIMTDANMGYDVEVALKAIETLEACGVDWLEEPLFVEDIEGHSQLRSPPKVPIAVGENLHTRFAFENYLARGAIDVLQPDVARAGGVSEVRRISAAAKQKNLPISLHTYGDAVILAASLHLTAALENSTVMELDCTYNPLRTEILQEPLEIKHGTMVPPQGSGLGVELNPATIKKYLVRAP